MNIRSLGSCAVATLAACALAAPVLAAAPAARPLPKQAPLSPQAELPSSCASRETLQERVRCRLQLTGADRTQDDAAGYLPEECRGESSELRRRSCAARYRSLAPCLAEPAGDGRSACAQEVLGLTQPVDELVRQCRGQRACQAMLQDKVYSLTKFRFVELEVRVEELLAAGAADLGQAATAISAIEEQLAAFNGAADARERQLSVYAVRKIWQEVSSAARRGDR